MAKVDFHKGSLGSPFQLEYMADQGIDARAPSERGPRIGAGVLGRRVQMEVSRDSSVSRKGRGRGKGNAEA